MPQLFLSMLSAAAIPVLLAVLAGFLLYLFKSSRYKQSEYYRLTQRSYWTTRTDAGFYGEYLTGEYLKNLGGTKRFLYNIYLPKDNGETTEIDVLLIHETGLYVFESKNYSGWIFGSENQSQWTQTLRGGQKNRFFNPIMQNELHIKWLKILLTDYPNIPYHSFVLFSDRCMLKNITLSSGKAEVINRYSVRNSVASRASLVGTVLDDFLMQDIYNRLYPYTQVSDELKQKHIADINNRIRKNPTSQPQPAVVNTSQTTAQGPMCPHCGKPLILRTASKGQHRGSRFWGCSGFPNCKYVEKLN